MVAALDLLTGVPAVASCTSRSCSPRFLEVARVEGDPIVGLDRIDGKPPVELRERSRVPRIPVGVERVSDACRQIVVGGCRTQAGNVVVDLLGIASGLCDE